MTDKELIRKIRDEIEQRLSNIVTGLDFTAEIELKGLLSFLDSIPPIQSLNRDHVAKIIELWEDVEHDAEWCNEPSEFMYDEVLRRFNLDTIPEQPVTDCLADSGKTLEQPPKTNALTWKDIIDIEQILNQVRYEHNCGIGEESFGKEVLERFLEQRDELREQPEDDVRNVDAQDKVEEKPGYCVPRYWDGQYDQSELFKEQPVEGLEREIIRYKVPFSDERVYLNEGTLDAIARHFYELGCRRTAEKDTIAKIREQVEGWMPDNPEGDEHTSGERVAFRSVLNLLKEMEE